MSSALQSCPTAAHPWGAGAHRWSCITQSCWDLRLRRALLKRSPGREGRGPSVFPPGPWLLSQRNSLQPLLVGAGPIAGWQLEGCLHPPFPLCPNPMCHRQDAVSWHELCEVGAANVPRAGGGGEAPPALTPPASPPGTRRFRASVGSTPPPTSPSSGTFWSC